MTQPTPPGEHSCWRSTAQPARYGSSPLTDMPADPADIATERTCPACQWLAGVEWLRAKTGLPLAAIEEGVVTLMRDVVAAVWDSYRTSTGLDTLAEDVAFQEDNMDRIFSILGGVPPRRPVEDSPAYKAGYEAGRAWAVAWLEGIVDECKRDSRLAAPVAATAATILAHELHKAIKGPPHA